ncbi:MAG: acyltransferase [Alphaproteobacteria bacterium]
MESRLLSIQYLRAFAALMVVVYHAMRWTHPSFEIGAAGVDVFFVISGFILWTIARERPMTAGVFLGRRWVRVAPLYWLLTLAVGLLAIRWPELIWDAHVTPRHLLLSLAFIQHLNPEGQPFPVITPGWSLNYEAVFYLIFAASLLTPLRIRIHILTLGLLAVPLFGMIVRPAYFLGANMMFFQFIAGVWLAEARLHGKLPSRAVGWQLAFVGLAAFAALSPLGLFENLFRPILWGVPAFLLVAGLVAVEAKGGLPAIKPLILLGDASYSIYLAHVIIVQVLSHPLRVSHLSFVPIALAASVAGGIACYYLLERPLIRLFRRPALPSGAD